MISQPAAKTEMAVLFIVPFVQITIVIKTKQDLSQYSISKLQKQPQNSSQNQSLNNRGYWRSKKTTQTHFGSDLSKKYFYPISLIMSI